MRISPSFLSLVVASFAWSAIAQDQIVEERRLVEKVVVLASSYLKSFQHPDTGILYGARLAGRHAWTSPEEVLQEKPHPWGYGSKIADTALHTGHMLVAFLDAYDARPTPFLKEQIDRLFRAMKVIGSLPETHPKAGKPALAGLVPRGPHPDDPSAYYDDSSMDQHTTFIISLAIYANSSIASDEDKAWIRETLGKVGRRLEKNDWSIKRADGVTQAHVGFSWKGFNSDHASILLPAVLALYHGTSDKHWLEAYELFLSEDKGRRWRQVHPGPHVRINGHPIYANQNAFRVNAWYRFEKSEKRRDVIRGLLKQSVEMQLRRDFPGEFYRKYHSEETWKTLSGAFDWKDTELRGADSAWDKFTPAMLDHDQKGLAALAHVRFPLGGFHMALLSESPDLIRQYLPAIWTMLNTVDLKKIGAGETHYLFTVVALHLYAEYFRNPELFSRESSPPAGQYGRELSLIGEAGTGPVMDVAVEDNLAFAIGRGALHILDITDRAKPRVVGNLSGLGSVRQIAVRNGIAFITSRQDGLFIADVSDSVRPRLLAHYDTIEFATGVAVSGDVLFVACRNYGVELIDVSKPDRPSHLSTVRTGEAQSVVARNGLLYVGVWAQSEVVVVDVRNPWQPAVVSRTALDGYGDGVDVNGDYLYVATGHHSRETTRRKPGDPGFGHGHGLEIFDIKDPFHPKFVSRVKFPPLYEIGNDMWSVVVSGRYAFVADTYNGAFIVDVVKPADSKIVGHVQLPLVEKRGKRGFVGGLAVVKDHVYLAGGYTDLHVAFAPKVAAPPREEDNTALEIGLAPKNLILDDGWRAYRPDGQVYGVDFLSDGRAVVACGSAGVHVLALWPEIKKLSVFETEGFATDVSISGNRIYIAESAGGLSVCEMATAGDQINRLSRFRIPGRAIRQVEAPKTGNHILIQSGANRFGILDVSSPHSVKAVLDEARPGLLYGDQMMRGLVDERYACVFWHVSGLHWYDLKADSVPVFSGDNNSERIGSANGLTAFRGKTLATVRGGFVVLDRRDKRPVGEIGIQPVGKRRVHLGVPTISGNLLYTANRSSGVITIADIADPANPRLIKQFETPGNPSRIAVWNGIAVIPDGYHGLLVLD